MAEASTTPGRSGSPAQMTPALKAMVEAMVAELVRQAEAEDGVRGGVVYETAPGEYTVDARGVDLEKVARAALEAIRAPGEPLNEFRDDESFYCNSTKQAEWSRVIDAILKEQP